MGTVHVRVGDTVRIRVCPDVDEQLWDETGLVAAFTPENRLVIELGDGADCTLNPDQLDLVHAEDLAAPFRGTLLEPVD